MNYSMMVIVLGLMVPQQTKGGEGDSRLPCPEPANDGVCEEGEGPCTVSVGRGIGEVVGHGCEGVCYHLNGALSGSFVVDDQYHSWKCDELSDIVLPCKELANDAVCEEGEGPCTLIVGEGTGGDVVGHGCKEVCSHLNGETSGSFVMNDQSYSWKCDETADIDFPCKELAFLTHDAVCEEGEGPCTVSVGEGIGEVVSHGCEEVCSHHNGETSGSFVMNDQSYSWKCDETADIDFPCKERAHDEVCEEGAGPCTLTVGEGELQDRIGDGCAKECSHRDGETSGSGTVDGRHLNWKCDENAEIDFPCKERGSAAVCEEGEGPCTVSVGEGSEGHVIGRGCLRVCSHRDGDTSGLKIVDGKQFSWKCDENAEIDFPCKERGSAAVCEEGEGPCTVSVGEGSEGHVIGRGCLRVCSHRDGDTSGLKIVDGKRFSWKCDENADIGVPCKMKRAHHEVCEEGAGPCTLTVGEGELQDRIGDGCAKVCSHRDGATSGSGRAYGGPVNWKCDDENSAAKAKPNSAAKAIPTTLIVLVAMLIHFPCNSE